MFCRQDTYHDQRSPSSLLDPIQSFRFCHNEATWRCQHSKSKSLHLVSHVLVVIAHTSNDSEPLLYRKSDPHQCYCPSSIADIAWTHAECQPLYHQQTRHMWEFKWSTNLECAPCLIVSTVWSSDLSAIDLCWQPIRQGMWWYNSSMYSDGYT